MEEKYDPAKIHTYNWGSFIILTKYRNSKPHHFDIFIEIKGHYDKWYHIYKDGKKGPVLLARGSFLRDNDPMSGENFRGSVQKNIEVLSKDKNFLERVYVRLHNDKIIRKYKDYEEFLGDIGA